ncbi:HAD-IA family hydrolase [Paenibacillus sp. TRM 82003]|nr:HAD-IA family hydrolase [Paenibacillus sp. TRM 82003]
MAMRTQLILDVGGVLGTNLDRYWEVLSASAAMPYAEVRRRYKAELRDTLWTGRLTEPGFFSWSCSLAPEMSEAEARSLMISSLQPLPAYERLAAWSETYDLHVLSNHRSEWLTPFLAPVRKYLRSVTISSEVSCAKPSADIYRLVQAKLPEGAPIVFVDDAEHNLEAARERGWGTLLADPDGLWMDKI